MSEARRLSRSQEYLLAVAAAVVTANAYYIHPIIGDVAAHFGVSDTQIGIVPALNQLALAVGILLLLPLGDRYSNKRLTILFAIGQTTSLALMTLSSGFYAFTAGSTLLGFFTITPYLLPAYASKRVEPERLGQVTALIAAGVILGILIARAGAGWVAEHYGWRAVYWIATSLMVAVTIALPRLMEGGEREEARVPYWSLVLSVFTIAKRHPEVLLSGAIQALNFAQFIALWLALALYLTGPAMGYGTDVVGYLAAVAAVSILSTPRLGPWADRVGPRTARFVLALAQMTGIALFWPLGGSVWGLIAPLVIVNLVGPGVDVTGRMTFLSLAPDLRTRLTTIYIVIMFIGGGVGSFLGTAIYDAAGWGGVCAMLMISTASLSSLAWIATKFGK